MAAVATHMQHSPYYRDLSPPGLLSVSFIPGPSPPGAERRPLRRQPQAMILRERERLMFVCSCVDIPIGAMLRIKEAQVSVHPEGSHIYDRILRRARDGHNRPQ